MLIEAKVAMVQRPSILAAEAHGNAMDLWTYGSSLGHLCFIWMHYDCPCSKNRSEEDKPYGNQSQNQPPSTSSFGLWLTWDPEIVNNNYKSWPLVVMPVHNNIWYMGKVGFHWERIENTSVILTDSFCNKTELYYNHIRIRYNTGTIGTIQHLI